MKNKARNCLKMKIKVKIYIFIIIEEFAKALQMIKDDEHVKALQKLKVLYWKNVIYYILYLFIAKFNWSYKNT